MKTTFKVGILSGLVALLAATGVQAADGDYSNTFTFGGDVELDLTARSPSDSNDTFTHGGRIKLNAVGQANRGDYFVKGVAQPMMFFNKESNSGDTFGTDDVYLQFGQKVWDVQIGRFEGIDLFPVGKDTVVEHAGGLSPYGTNGVRGRFSDVPHAAVHVHPSENVNFELGAVYEKDGSESTKGIRPAVTFKAGAATIRAGMENLKGNAYEDTDGDAGTADVIAETSHTGYGLGVGYAVGGGTVNASLAKKNVKKVKDADGNDITSAALNYSNSNVGLGYIYSKEDNTDAKVNTLYGAYTMPLMGIKDATVTLAASTSKADNVSTDDKVNAVRVRFNYAF